ncbi:MAG: hypothetical protein WDO06_00265 [Actinomycetota bacterium]
MADERLAPPTRELSRPATIFVSLFVILALLTPLPFVVIEPGGGRNVLGSLIAIEGTKTYPTTGELLLTTVLCDESRFANLCR